MMHMESQLQPLISIPDKINCYQPHWMGKSKFGTPKKQPFNTLCMVTTVAPLQVVFPLTEIISPQGAQIRWSCSGSQILAKTNYKEYNLSILIRAKPELETATRKIKLVELNQKYQSRKQLDKRIKRRKPTLNSHKYLNRSKELLI